MTKRTQHIESEEFESVSEAYAKKIADSVDRWVNVEPEFQRLIDSSIVVAAEGAISWREGHLEHVAKLYAGDPAQTWRDYADDLTVALAADGSNFAALVERARGE